MQVVAQPRILLLDKHPVFLIGLSNLISAHFKNNVDVISFDTLLNAKNEVASNQKIDLAIVEILLTDGKHPSEIISEFANHNIPTLVLSDSTTSQSIKASIIMGAKGYVGKSSPVIEIIKCNCLNFKRIRLDPTRSW